MRAEGYRHCPHQQAWAPEPTRSQAPLALTRFLPQHVLDQSSRSQLTRPQASRLATESMPVHLEALIGGTMSNKKLRIPGPARTSRLGEPSRRGKTYHYVLRAFPNGHYTNNI